MKSSPVHVIITRWLAMLLTMLLLSSGQGHIVAQDNSRTYDLVELNESGHTIIHDGSDVYVYASSICDLNPLRICWGVFKLTSELDTIWKMVRDDGVEYSGAGNSTRDLFFKGDTLVLPVLEWTHVPDSNVFKLYHISPETGQIIQDIHVPLINYRAHQDCIWDPRGFYWLLYWDFDSVSKLVCIDASGHILKERVLFEDLSFYSPGSMHLTQDGHLYINGKACCWGETSWSWAYPALLDTSTWESIFAYPLPDAVFGQVSIGLPMSDGRFAVQWRYEDWEIDQDKQVENPRLYMLSSTGGIEWTYDWTVRPAWAYIINLMEASNGDLIGVGHGRIGLEDDRVGGWIWRISPQGDFVWDHIILDERWDRSEGAFVSVVEDDEGMLYVSGDIRDPLEATVANATFNMWVVKLDADGCLQPGCMGTEDILTSVDDPPLPSAMLWRLYPNPVDDVLTLDWSTAETSIEVGMIHIRSVDGRHLRSILIDAHHRQYDVHVGDLPSGVYVAGLLDSDGRLVARQQWIKMAGE